MGGAGRGKRPRETPTVTMEHRERPQIVRARTDTGVIRHRQRLQVGAAMVVHNAFGPPGGTRGVVDGEQPAFVDVTPDRGAGGGEQRLVLVVGAAGDHHPDADRLGDRPRRIRELVRRHQQACAAVIEDVAQLGFGQSNVERHQHRSGARYCVVHLQHHVAVGAQRRDAVARPDTEAGQCRRQLRCPLVELGVAERAVAVDDGGALGEHRRSTRQKRHRTQRREREVGRRGSVRVRHRCSTPSSSLAVRPPGIASSASGRRGTKQHPGEELSDDPYSGAVGAR